MTEKTSALPWRLIVAGILFAAAATGLAFVTPSVQVAWVTALLLLTIYLFAFEVVGVDVAAISVMVLLGLTTLLAPYMGLEEGLVVGLRDLNEGLSKLVASMGSGRAPTPKEEAGGEDAATTPDVEDDDAA